MKDAVLLKAISDRVGHPPPFSHGELSSVKMLILRGASDLEGLGGLPNLGSLSVVNSDVRSLPDLSGCKELGTVYVEFSPFVDSASLATLPLNSLHIEHALIRDIVPVSEMPGDPDFGLEWVTLRGLPLDTRSREVGIPAIRERLPDPTNLVLSPPEAFDITREMFERGLRATYDIKDDDHEFGVLGFPGKSIIEGLDEAELHIKTADLREMLRKPNLTEADLIERFHDPAKWEWLAGVYNRVMAEKEAERKARAFKWAEHSEVGGTPDALAWIRGSDLPDKDDLEALVRRFPNLRWWRYDAVAADYVATRNDLDVPTWYRQLQRQFMGPYGDRGVWFSLDQDVHWMLENDTDDYLLSFPARVGDEGLQLIREAGYWPFADNIEKVLAFSIDDPSDRAIYAFTMDDLWEGDFDGSSVYEVFKSWADMWRHVREIKPKNAA